MQNNEITKKCSLLMSELNTYPTQKTLVAIEELYKLQPQNVDVVLLSCHVAMMTKRYDLAITRIKLAMQSSRDRFLKLRYLPVLGSVYYLQVKFEFAIQSYAEAIQILCDLVKNAQTPKFVEKQTKNQLVGGLDKLYFVLTSAKQEDIACFPHAGTLLGLVREGKLLEFDKDLDIGVWLEDFKILCKHIERLGMKKTYNYPAIDNYACYIDLETGITFDICALRREPENRIVTGGFWYYTKPSHYQRITKYPWFNLVEQQTDKGVIFFPDTPKKLLNALYGENWQIPDSAFDTILSAPNIIQGGLQQICHGYAKILDIWLSGDMTKLVAYCNQMLNVFPDNPLILQCQKSLQHLITK